MPAQPMADWASSKAKPRCIAQMRGFLGCYFRHNLHNFAPSSGMPSPSMGISRQGMMLSLPYFCRYGRADPSPRQCLFPAAPSLAGASTIQ